MNWAIKNWEALAAFCAMAGVLAIVLAINAYINTLETRLREAQEAVASEVAAHSLTKQALTSEREARSKDASSVQAALKASQATCQAMIQLAKRQTQVIERVFDEPVSTGNDGMRRLDADVLRELAGAATAASPNQD